MKKLTFFTLTTLAITSAFGQNNSNPWPTTGNVGIGTTAPTSNLQIHGTTDYIVTGPAGPFGGTPVSTNYGKTSKLALTNSTAGSTANDGTLIRMSALNFSIQNQESGNVSLGTGTITFNLSGQTSRINAISGLNSTVFNSGTSTNYGSFNIYSTIDNGLYIQSTAANKYGLKIRTRELTDALQILNNNGQLSFRVVENGLTELIYNVPSNTDDVFIIRNSDRKLLQVDNDGLLHARRIKVDTDSWSDFVFDENYRLMPLVEVNNFIQLNNHLPNVPSESEVKENGVDLLEMNKILLQKVEELTLYILEQQNEIDIIKNELNKK